MSKFRKISGPKDKSNKGLFFKNQAKNLIKNMANGHFEMGDRDMFENSKQGFEYEQDKLFELKDKIRNGIKLTDAELDL